jgi:hypothetical protein
MNENNYYRCTVKIEYEGKKGNTKYRKENYIVSAVNPTDVEVKMRKHLEMTDYEIVGINVMSIIDIIR